MSLQRSSNFGAKAWIDHDRDKPIPRAISGPWPGAFVSNCVPVRFSAYAKLLHAIGSGSTGQRVYWRELAARCGIGFHSGMDACSFTLAVAERRWPRDLIGPAEGRLDADSSRALVRALEPFTRNQTCWFYYRGLTIRDSEPRLYCGDLPDVLSLPAQDGVTAMPEYWWPEDRRWCVCSDFDLSFTLIGGPSELIQVCLENGALETLPVARTDRIDPAADVYNARKSMMRFAERFLSGKMSVIVAARTMARVRHCLGPEFADFLQPFAIADRDSLGLPVGELRALWAPEALLKHDVRIRDVEARHLCRLQKACRDILLPPKP